MDNRLQQKIQQRMQSQQSNIDTQRQQLEDIRNAPQQIDLSPLMSLTDAWTGSNFSRNYQRPETKQERAYKAAQLEQGLQRQEQGLLNSELQMLAMLEKRNNRKAKDRLDLTPLEEKRDKDFGKTFQEFTDAGGYANIAGNLDLLRGVSRRLGSKEGDDLVNTVQPKVLRDFFNPESSAAQEDVETVVQQSLKAILGGQFSEKEAKQLIERAYNPRLSPEINKAKLDSLIKKIEAGARAKQSAIDYAVEKGTLKGFKGKSAFSLKDFEPGKDQEETREYNGKTYKKVGDKWVQQ